MVERFLELVEMLVACGDVNVWKVSDSSVSLTFEDFEGFDDDWSEIMREYEEPDLVEELEELIEELGAEGDFYEYLTVNGVEYSIGYASFDI